MFTLTIKLDPATMALATRALDYLEGVQQKKIDGYVARMEATRERLAKVINLNSVK